MTWQTGTVEINGGHLAWHRTGGPGPVLVLSHGLSDNGLCWSRTAQALSADYDVVMLDARGHGESSRTLPGAPHDPAQDLADAITGLGLQAPILMGHSVGARAAAACANSCPDLPSLVILEDPPFLPEISPAEAARHREAFRTQITALQRLSDEDITAAGRKTAPSWHADEFPAWTLGKRQVDPAAAPQRFQHWPDLIDRIAVPTLLLYGETERGGLVTAAIAQAAMQRNPRVQAVQISGAGHNIRRENFADFMAAVRAFLDASHSLKEPGR